jgi:hypothetical protein
LEALVDKVASVVVVVVEKGFQQDMSFVKMLEKYASLLNRVLNS